ncbi:AraC family transcriptional regulator [uncultured Actinomyces sp.]|uniref:AraC family transcriptional regulator n=1 Tax=uncultured Actinomyces sp. TaxID=249061 RepID=UPI003456547A
MVHKRPRLLTSFIHSPRRIYVERQIHSDDPSSTGLWTRIALGSTIERCTPLARIEQVFRARSLLQRGLSPADVSASAGYADQSHLTREFARTVGVTPVQFSKAAKRSTLLPSGSSTVA